MYLIEKLSNSIASKIASASEMDKKKEAIIAYGAYGLIQIIYSIALTVVVGLVLGVLKEAIVISFCAAYLRKYSGGVHASTPNRCAVTGAIIFGIMAVVASKIHNMLGIQELIGVIAISFIISLYIIYRYSPVDSPNKPIKKEEQRKRLRRKSFVTLWIIFTIASILLLIDNFYQLNTSNLILNLLFGMVWQSVLLTPMGHWLIFSLDNILDNIIKGGENI